MVILDRGGADPRMNLQRPILDDGGHPQKDDPTGFQMSFPSERRR